MKKIYLVSRIEDDYRITIFATPDEEKARRYVERFNSLVEKWRKYYRRFLLSDDERHFRGIHLNQIGRCYFEEIEIR